MTVSSLLRDALEGAGCEAGRIAATGLKLQTLLSPAVQAGPDQAGLQALDVLVQEAAGLQSFLAALAGLCPDSWRVDAARAAAELVLHAQRCRLEPGAMAQPVTAPSGVLELF